MLAFVGGRFQGRLEMGSLVISIAAKSQVICLPSVSAWSREGSPAGSSSVEAVTQGPVTPQG